MERLKQLPWELALCLLVAIMFSVGLEQLANSDLQSAIYFVISLVVSFGCGWTAAEWEYRNGK